MALGASKHPHVGSLLVLYPWVPVANSSYAAVLCTLTTDPYIIFFVGALLVLSVLTQSHITSVRYCRTSTKFATFSQVTSVSTSQKPLFGGCGNHLLQYSCHTGKVTFSLGCPSHASNKARTVLRSQPCRNSTVCSLPSWQCQLTLFNNNNPRVGSRIPDITYSTVAWHDIGIVNSA